MSLRISAVGARDTSVPRTSTRNRSEFAGLPFDSERQSWQQNYVSDAFGNRTLLRGLRLRVIPGSGLRLQSRLADLHIQPGIFVRAIGRRGIEGQKVRSI